MMIKGWIKHQTLKNQESWVHIHKNPFGETYIGITKWSDGKWRVYKKPAFGHISDFTIVYRKSKKEAKMYAIDYMKSHPEG